jgi:hypothetical protein
MTFIRPELRQAIWRFREVIIGIAVSLLGLYWAINGLGFMQILGTSVAIAGALLVFAGIQRSRFRNAQGGRGLVHVDEGQVTYFGPYEGGSVVIAELARVELDPLARPVAEWVFHAPGAAPLRIPTNAEGAEALFDVFSNLEGLQMERMLAQIRRPPETRVVIWQAKSLALH